MALQEEILAAAPSASIHGHPRKGWEPLPLEDVKPEKGAFVVKVAGQVVVSVGPEPRPFNTLRALDIVDAAKKVVSVLEQEHTKEQG